jgi:hypothetical protein
MPRNGSGVYTVYTPGNPVVAGTTIDPTAFNNTTNDLATALTNSLASNGETAVTANLPMAGFKHTGAGNASASGQYLVYGQTLPATAFSGALTGITTLTASGTGIFGSSGGNLLVGTATNANNRNVLVNGRGVSGATYISVTDSGSTSQELVFGFDASVSHAYINSSAWDLRFTVNGSDRASFDTSGNFAPITTNAYTCGGSALRWSNVYGVLGNFSGAVTVGTLTTALGAVTSGTYTPTLTNGANVGSSSSAVCQYIQVGSVVHVTGVISVQTTAGASTATVLGISLPVASNFATQAGLSGTGARILTGGVANYDCCTVFGDTTNHRASVQFNAGAASNATMTFTFSYLVV